MRGKMLFVSIALLVMLFFVETASAQVDVATLEELQAALAGSDETITVTQTIVIDEDLTLDGGGKTVKLDSNARIRLINSATFEHITIDGGELQRSYPLVVVEGNGGITLTLGDGAIIQNARTSGNGGGVLVNPNNTLDMKSGSAIQNCHADKNGGAVELFEAKLQMNGGSILNCTAQNGGSVYLGSGSVVQMDDGTISGCKADENGGAIFSYVDSGSNEVNLTGGTIEGNSAKIGGGVYINYYTVVEPTTAPPVQGSEARCFRGCIQPHRRHVLRQYGDGRRRGFGDCFRQSCFAGHAGRAV